MDEGYEQYDLLKFYLHVILNDRLRLHDNQKHHRGTISFIL